MTLITRVLKVRKCGRVKEGGTYLVTGTNLSKDGVLPKFITIEPPIPNPGPFSRGPIIVDGNQILAGKPYDEWLAGTSKARLEDMKGDAWAKEVFGMTAHRRLVVGECQGLINIDEALACLAGKIAWSYRIMDELRALVIHKVPEMPRLAEPYARLIRACQAYADNRMVDSLMSILAATWRMADVLPPSKRAEVIPTLQRIVMLLNLPKDAMALRNLYSSEKTLL